MEVSKILEELRQERAELDKTVRELERLAAGPGGPGGTYVYPNIVHVALEPCLNTV
jgi:hypothetical protein